MSGAPNTSASKAHKAKATERARAKNLGRAAPRTIRVVYELDNVPAPGGGSQLVLVPNTFYWDKKAWATAPGDYSKAHLYHWLQVDGADRASGTLESEKPAFENRVWYRYPGQPTNTSVNIGSSPQPSIIARRIEDGFGGFTAEVSRHTYNEL